ncbi:hypothetical protein VKI22_17935 [Cyanobacterium aponinum UTEX 3221]|uniref:hypothetical protein n=1 Tax=Cyanobacterium aponinum TaxID=379064 RepID=UPI002B4BC1C4|nr:hypothetical protein [Cyanobacterium aponinum]WRL38468.1 hypothetical protein VKI22_17935 [Cyanobacterium aponinum UTEX 3221]
MSKVPMSVHPLIKKIIQNLDLDLGAELRRYEKDTVDSNILIPELIETESIDLPSNSSSLVYHLPLDNYDEDDEDDEDEPIPVASRLISRDRASLLDLILTPWGIFGIIMFFGTNILIFLGINNFNFNSSNQKAEIVDQSRKDQQIINEVTPEIEKKDEQIIEENEQKSPPLPSSLPSVDNANITNNIPASPYPDLKTALMKEINNNELSESSLPLPPPLSEENSNTLPNQDEPIEANSSSQNNQKKEYIILTNYENMTQFNNIKKEIPNAFITNIEGEMKIQLGVFNTEIEAKTKSQQWQKQGIKTFLK